MYRYLRNIPSIYKPFLISQPYFQYFFIHFHIPKLLHISLRPSEILKLTKTGKLTLPNLPRACFLKPLITRAFVAKDSATHKFDLKIQNKIVKDCRTRSDRHEGGMWHSLDEYKDNE
jgi:hypothetical protein